MTTFTGTTGNDILPLTGADNSGDDILYGLAGHDKLYGGAGNDLLVGGTGIDTLFGDGGVDTASYAGAAGAMTVSLTNYIAVGSDAGGAGERLYDIENLIGSAYGDRLSGSSAANSLVGGDGNDSLQGYAGNDSLQGGNGDDTLDGGTSDDQLDGGSGNDTLVGGAGADFLTGGNGVDTASYASSAAGIGVDLSQVLLSSGGDAEGDRLSGIENLVGSAYNDTVFGNTASNVISGDGGADFLTGEGGNDTIQGGAGGDYLSGGDGIDTVTYSSSTAGVTVDLVAHTGWNGDAQHDRLWRFENVIGSASDDALFSDGSANLLDGGAGNDGLGGAGGKDTLIGGAGADRFIFSVVEDSGPSSSQRDVIRDFSGVDGDRVDLSGIDARPSIPNVDGNQAFIFLGTGASFTGSEGELTFALGLLEGDVNGDRVTDFSIQLNGVTTMSASDFIL